MKRNILSLIILTLLCRIDYGQTTITLRNALSLARQNNLFYKAELFNKDVSQTEVINAKLRINPELGISSQQIAASKYIAENTGLYNSANRQTTYQFTKPFAVAGQRKYQIAEAESGLKLTESSLSEYERNLFMDVAGQWLDVWYAGEKLNIVKRAMMYADTLLKINKIRLDNQYITVTEYTRTEIMSEQYSIMLNNSGKELESERHQLQLVINSTDDVSIDETDSVFSIPISLFIDSMVIYALNNRTDILIYQNAINVSKVDIQLQKALAYPQPVAGFSYGAQNQIPYMGLYLGVPIPFFNRNQAHIAKANIMLQQSEQTLNATIQKVRNEVTISYKEYLVNKASYERYKTINSKSEEVLKIVKKSYLKGGTTIIDYLEAAKNWFELQNLYNEASYNYKKSYIELLYYCNLINAL